MKKENKEKRKTKPLTSISFHLNRKTLPIKEPMKKEDSGKPEGEREIEVSNDECM